MLTHVKRTHSYGNDRSIKDLRIQLTERSTWASKGLLAKHVAAKASDSTLPKPISGLILTTVYACSMSGCEQVCTDRKRLNAHIRTVHSLQPKEIFPGYKRAAHPLGFNQERSWLIVSSMTPEPAIPADSDNPFYSAISPMIDSLMKTGTETMVNLRSGVRQMSDFHSQSGWADVLETVGLGPVAEVGLRHPSGSDPAWILVLFGHAKAAWNAWEAKLADHSGHSFRKTLKEESAHASREYFQRLQNSSRQSYSSTFGSVILITLRYAFKVVHCRQDEAEGPCPFLLSDTVRAAFRRVEQMATMAGRLSPNQAMVAITDWFSALVNEKYATLDIWQDPLQWFMLGSTLRCGDGSKKEPEPRDEWFGDEDEDAVDSDIVNGEDVGPTIISPNRYSGIFAHLQYSIRLLLWSKAHDMIQSRKEDGILLLAEYCDVQNTSYIYARVRQALCRARKARLDLPPRLSKSFVGNKLCLTIGRNCVTQDRLQMAIKNVALKLEKMLEDTLLLGLGEALPRHEDGVVIQDDMRADMPGYSFLADPINRLGGEKRTALIHLLTRRGDLSAVYFHKNESGGLEFDAKAIRAYLASHHEFLRVLFVALHLACGVPARGAEYNTLLLVNTGDRYRSLFHDPNGVFLMFRYCKQTGVYGPREAIPKYPGKRIGDMLLRYLTYALPTAIAFAEHQWKEAGAHGHGPHEQMKTHLFCSSRGILSGGIIGMAFSDVMATVGDLPVGLADYRHVSLVYAQTYIAREIQDMSAVYELIELAAAHSLSTARTHYGTNDSEPINGLEDVLLKQHLLCQAWHKWIGITVKGEALSDSTEVTFASHPNRLALREQLGPCDTDYRGMASAIAADDLKVQKMLNQISSLQLNIQRCHESLARTMMYAAGPGTSISLSGVAPAALLQNMRDALGDQTVMFRDRNMLRALDVIMLAKPDVLAIFPTGSGKSTLIWLPPLMERKTTVLISLYTQLGTDIVDTAMLRGLKAVKWRKGISLDAIGRLLVIMVDQMPDANDTIKNLNVAGKLCRLVVDEAHTLLTGSEYRSKLGILTSLKSTLGLTSIPWLWLTATLPVPYESAMFRVLRTRKEEVYTIRSSSNRPNLRYWRNDAPLPYRHMTAADLPADFIKSPDGWFSEVVREITVQLEAHVSNDPKEPARAIVYAPWKSTVKRLHGEVYSTGPGVPRIRSTQYHGDMDQAAKNKATREWRSGTFNVMFATSGFGQGVDYPAVRLVICVGSPYSLVDFAQQAGRAGRDRKQATILMIAPYEELPPPNPTEDRTAAYEEDVMQMLHHTMNAGGMSPIREVYDLFTDRDACVRYAITAHMDDSPQSCLVGDPGTVLCSACDKALIDAKKTAHRGEHAFHPDFEIGKIKPGMKAAERNRLQSADRPDADQRTLTQGFSRARPPVPTTRTSPKTTTTTTTTTSRRHAPERPSGPSATNISPEDNAEVVDLCSSHPDDAEEDRAALDDLQASPPPVIVHRRPQPRARPITSTTVIPSPTRPAPTIPTLTPGTGAQSSSRGSSGSLRDGDSWPVKISRTIEYKSNRAYQVVRAFTNWKAKRIDSARDQAYDTNGSLKWPCGACFVMKQDHWWHSSSTMAEGRGCPEKSWPRLGCLHCGEDGHGVRDCPIKRAPHSDLRLTFPNGSCHHCGCQGCDSRSCGIKDFVRMAICSMTVSTEWRDAIIARYNPKGISIEPNVPFRDQTEAARHGWRSWFYRCNMGSNIPNFHLVWAGWLITEQEWAESKPTR